MKRFFMMSVTAILCIVLGGCYAGSTFEGNISSGADCFQMDYKVLNQQEKSFLALTTGESLRVCVAQEAGTVDVVVGIDGKEPIYEGNRLTDTTFALNISESGNYQIAVTGHNACGSVSFIKVAGESETVTSKPNAPVQGVMYAAYQFVLQQIAFEHIYPDGTDTGFDNANGFIEENHFSVFDINNDGAEELIVQFVTAPMAGNMETVYAYNEAENTVDKILTVFPAVTYYDNGLVKEEWSHSYGLEGEDYWPYTLYQYQADSGVYEVIAEVNMWSKAVDTVDYKGEPYPEDVDAENAGTVFILTRHKMTETVCKSDYEAWLAQLMENAQPIQVPYLPLSEDNIKAVSQS